MNSLRRMVHCDIWRTFFAGMVFVMAGFATLPASAQSDDDLPGRVGRVAEVGGELFLAPQDAPDQWVTIGLNYPVTTGDNLWVGNEGRAEIDFGGGQFRLSGDTSLHVSRLDDRNFALFVAQGRVILRVRVLEPGETARIDTPNTQVIITRPGLYRIEVSEDRQHTQLAVREGAADIDTGTMVQQVLPGQSATLDGVTPAFALLRNGVTTDGFDTWSANRDRRYERSRANSPVSRQMVGYADLDEFGTWDTAPEYGAVWFPSIVAVDWAPYRNGYWTDVGAWGPTWVDAAPWGYAPFHYGRWAHIRGRWGWCPGAFVLRPIWAPALVGWVGGPGWRFSTNYGSPVYGWVPLGWGEAYHPHWKSCSDACWARYNKPYAVNIAVRPNAPPARYANWTAPGAITAVPGSAFTGRKPVQSNLVAISGSAMASAPMLPAPLIRPEIRHIPGVKPGNGIPPPASTFYATTPRLPRSSAPGGAIPAQGVTVAVPQVSRSAASVSAPSSPNPVTKPVQVAPVPTVNTYTQPVQRPAPVLVSPPAGSVPVAVPPPRPASARERSVVPGTLAPGPPVAHPVPVAPAAHALPGAPPAVVPNAHPGEKPKTEKPAAPVVRVPGDAPATQKQ